MKYYLVTIQFNAEKGQTNRTIPKEFDNVNDAIAEFHSQMGKDMKNATLGWATSIVFNSEGGIIRDERMDREYVPEVVEEA